MKKLSERAIEIMVDNDKSDGFLFSYRIHNYPGYPSFNYITTVDLAQALDEYQEQVKARLDANQNIAQMSLDKATEALRLAKLGPDPRLSGNWSDGRS